jgi:hypothetical protein
MILSDNLWCTIQTSVILLIDSLSLKTTDITIAAGKRHLLK